MILVCGNGFARAIEKFDASEFCFVGFYFQWVCALWAKQRGISEQCNQFRSAVERFPLGGR